MQLKIPAPRKKTGENDRVPAGVNIVAIDVSAFHPGMYLDSDIYIKIADSYVLFCRNVMIDNALLERMKHMAEGADQKVYVADDQYEKIRQQSRDFGKVEDIGDDLESPEAIQKLIEKKQKEIDDFLLLTDESKEILNFIGQASVLPTDKIDSFVNSIADKVTNSDVSIILQCINNIRESDDYLYSHSTNVATLNGLIGGWMDLSAVDVDTLIRIGFMHDLGKLKIPDEILNKPAKLTDEEYEVIKKHPDYSFDILKASGITDRNILMSVRAHQERMNGTGYPDGTMGRDIPLFARITAVSDVYDAMVSKRPYKPAHSPFHIMAEFSRSRFSDLDLQIVDVFLSNVPKYFIGKRVLLSDGRYARVNYINHNDFEFPIVRIGDQLIKTNKYLRCVEVDSFTLDDLMPHEEENPDNHNNNENE